MKLLKIAILLLVSIGYAYGFTRANRVDVYSLSNSNFYLNNGELRFCLNYKSNTCTSDLTLGEWFTMNHNGVELKDYSIAGDIILVTYFDKHM